MKKYFKTIIISAVAILAIPFIASASLTPVSWIRDTVAGFVRPGILTDTLRIPSLTNCDTIDTDADGDFTCGTDGGGGGGDALTSNPLSQFASTTSAQLAGVISNETGFTTGALSVFSINPTITGALFDGDIELDSDGVLNIDDTGILRFSENDANGSNFKGFTAPASITTSTTCTFEDDSSFIPDSCVGDGVDGGGAPTDADYLVGTANGSLSAEIVVGTSPGGELGGTWASPTLDDSVTTTGWIMGTFSATQLTSPTVLIDLLDAVGAVDMDYGSADVTDHTFTTDGTGTAEIVLPTGSIDSTEILNATILAEDLKAVDSPSDEECLTKEDTTGDFEWQSCGGIPTQITVANTGGDTTSFFAIFDSETGDLQPKTDTNLKWNATSNILEIDGPAQIGGNARPVTNDGGALGTSSFNWSDLFLALGSVINWNAGDLTLTHSADTLTLAGGTLVLPASGLQVGSSNPFSDSSGTLTLQNVDAIDATTETTLEGALDIAGDITGTGLTAVTIGADKVLESHLKAVDAAGDEECLTYESTVGDFEWQTCGAGGSFDSTTVDATTWSDGANASNTWTFDVSGTDTTWTMGNNNWVFGTGSVDLGSAGVRLSHDGDGALTFLGLGNGSDEDLTLNLDDTSNTGVFSSSTGLATLNFSSIALQSSGVAIPTISSTDTLTNKTIAAASNVLDACVPVAVTDEYSNLTTGTAKATFRMPFAMTVTSVRASLVTAATGATLVTVDINETGTTILSTKITFDASETTSTSAATAAVVSDSSLADDAVITVDIDAVGNTTPGNGLKISICGTI